MHRIVITVAAIVLSAGLLGCPAQLPVTSIPSVPGSGVYVNIQVDAEGQDTQGLTDMVNALKERGMRTTIFVTGEFANSQAMLVRSLYLDGFEIALHGYSTGEQLATMTYDEQKNLISRAKQAVEGCEVCGMYKPVVGFRPQYFSQNEDTYRVLDELGLTHNSGFKAGVLYTEGHQDDVAPYSVEGHQFAAVPITTVEYDGRRIYLCDMACAIADKLPAQQWAQALQMVLDQTLQPKQPLVVLLHCIITGDQANYTYWQPYLDFLDAVVRAQCTVVTTNQLVGLYAQ